MIELLKSAILFYMDFWIVLPCVITGRADVRGTVQLKRKMFPLRNLPLLAIIEIVKLMSHEERFKLSLTSKLMTFLAKVHQLPPADIVADIGKDSVTITVQFGKVNPIKFEIYCISNGFKRKKEEKELWLKSQSDSYLTTTGQAIQQLQSIFLTQVFLIKTKTEFIEKGKLKEILTEKYLKTWNAFSIDGGNQTTENLNMIMDLASPMKRIEFVHSTMPEGFRHEKAFKFLDSDYSDARWVKMEDLYALKGNHNLTLGRTNFTAEEVKTFVNYWVNSDVDMFWWMDLRVNPNQNLSGILEGLVVLEHLIGANILVEYTLAKTTSLNRQCTVLAANRAIGSVIFSAWDPEENFPAKDGQPREVRKIYEILKWLEAKKTLEETLKMVDNDFERNRLQLEVEKLVVQLEENEVVFLNGKATIFS